MPRPRPPGSGSRAVLRTARVRRFFRLAPYLLGVENLAVFDRPSFSGYGFRGTSSARTTPPSPNGPRPSTTGASRCGCPSTFGSMVLKARAAVKKDDALLAFMGREWVPILVEDPPPSRDQRVSVADLDRRSTASTARAIASRPTGRFSWSRTRFISRAGPHGSKALPRTPFGSTTRFAAGGSRPGATSSRPCFGWRTCARSR